MVPYERTVTRRNFAFVLALCALCSGAALGRAAQPAHGTPSVTLGSGLYQSRTTIPVTVDGQRAACVLDTGSSAILVSPQLARAAGLAGGAGTFEQAPDGQTYVDRETQIPRFGIAKYTLRGLPALISGTLRGDNALCGYDFFTRFPTLIDRAHRAVTLFPATGRLARMHCLHVALGPRVPLATVEINGTWIGDIVLDSGMVGGSALWNGVQSQLRRPLTTTQSAAIPAMRDGFQCGASAAVRFASATPANVMPVCTIAQRPDGYNGIVETNLPSISAMAVDYPHRRVCFEVAGISTAWSRFDDLRQP